MSLDEKTNVPADPVHEEFLPPSDWDRQKESDTLILMLPGFRKEQLRVQVSSDRVLRLSGERKISENKLRRFRVEEKLSDNHDTNGINAKFEAGMLYVRLPKVPKPQPPPPPPTPTQEPPKPQQPTTTDAQQPADQKEPKEDKTTEPKTEAQTPLVQEPKADHDDSQKQPTQKEKAESEANNKISEAQEMHETAQTTFQEQKEDSQTQKERGKAETGGNEMGEPITSKAQGTSPHDDGLSKSSVAWTKKSLDMVSRSVEEVKKKNKMANFAVLIFLVLAIGLYIKSLVKSSFGGPKIQEF
ncbi:23.2 kDa heat shock protein [Spatholobus suberectus]|nr:23.2 kDa heat shock protein [Spatholobus suberectus]